MSAEDEVTSLNDEHTAAAAEGREEEITDLDFDVADVAESEKDELAAAAETELVAEDEEAPHAESAPASDKPKAETPSSSSAPAATTADSAAAETTSTTAAKTAPATTETDAGSDDEEVMRVALSVADANMRETAAARAAAQAAQARSTSAPGTPGGSSAAGAEGGAAGRDEAARIEADERSVFVNNVHFRTTAEELTQFFQDGAGPVERVTLLRDKFTQQPRGIAYVEFVSRDSVEAALALNGAEFNGRNIEVRQKRTNDYRVALRGRRGAMMRGGFGMGVPYMMPFMYGMAPYGYPSYPRGGRGGFRGGHQ